MGSDMAGRKAPSPWTCFQPMQGFSQPRGGSLANGKDLASYRRLLLLIPTIASGVTSWDASDIELAIHRDRLSLKRRSCWSTLIGRKRWQILRLWQT